MRNLSLLIPILHDATSFYRGMGPLGHLAYSHPQISMNTMNKWDWSTLKGCHGVFLQRPFTKEHRDVFEICKASNKKVWIDYDDFLFDIPTDNPTYFTYMNPEIQANLEFITKHADFVSVSTPRLAEELSKLSKNVRIIPNALDTAMFPYRKNPEARTKKIIWRGSRTHQKDVFVHSPQILEIANQDKTKVWDWHFIGDNVWFLTDRMPHERTYVTKAMDVTEYHEHIWRLCPSAMMVPLHDSVFNRCKSNIAWIEGTFAGAVTIAPDWDCWRVPGVLTYSNADQFKSALWAVTQGEIDIAKTNEQSWEHVMENFTLDRVNKARAQILCEMWDCTPKDLGGI